MWIEYLEKGEKEKPGFIQMYGAASGEERAGAGRNDVLYNAHIQKAVQINTLI